jgi:cell division protein FtsL
MSRLNLLLLLLLVASCLVLVKAAYDTRRLRSEMHRAEVEIERLEGERKQYEAERQLQATTVRVDRAARDKLGMFTVTPAVTMYETLASAQPAAVASAPGTGASR